MRARIETASLWLLASVFTVVAAIGLCAPSVLFDPTGVALDTLAGVAEIRAAYCGHFGGAAYVFAMGARDSSRRELALFLAVLVLGGFVLGRLLSWGLDGAPEAPVAIINLAAESVGLVAALLLWRGHRASTTVAEPSGT